MNAILAARCPRCHKGAMFVKPITAYPFLAEMHEDCPYCGLHFEREPGFYQGAMYVGYALSVALVIACGIAVTVLADDAPAWVYVTVTVASALVLAPLNFRYSRVLMLHLFGDVKFDPEAAAGRIKGY